MKFLKFLQRFFTDPRTIHILEVGVVVGTEMFVKYPQSKQTAQAVLQGLQSLAPPKQ